MQRSAVWCPCGLRKIRGETHSAQSYGMLLLWVNINTTMWLYIDKHCQEHPFTSLIPHVLGNLLLISRCWPGWAWCFYLFSYMRAAGGMGHAQGLVSPSTIAEALGGIWWFPEIRVSPNHIKSFIFIGFSKTIQIIGQPILGNPRWNLAIQIDLVGFGAPLGCRYCDAQAALQRPQMMVAIVRKGDDEQGNHRKKNVCLLHD